MATNRTEFTPISCPNTSIQAFSAELFGHLPRRDQRRWAETYLRGLLTTPGKKSVRRMAAAVTGGPTASQSLHQFVNASPWPWDPSRCALARWTERRATVRAWSIVPVVAPKKGEHSVGVQRRFDTMAGRVINCQVSAGLLMSTCCGDVPVDWRLQLPETWCADPQLRRRAKIPDSCGADPLWALALRLVDAHAERCGEPLSPVLADAREFVDQTALVDGLSSRRSQFAVSVSANLTLRPGLPPVPERRSRAVSSAGRLCVDDHISRRSTSALVHAPRGHNQHAAALWTLSGPVHLPQSRHTLRLLAKWHPRIPRPARIWLTNIVHTEVDELVALVATQDRTLAAMQSLREQFGFLDFEGRSFPGWHRHMTLASAAYGWHRLSKVATHSHMRVAELPMVVPAEERQLVGC